MPVYVLDTNFFIQAHKESYPLDIMTSFWNTIQRLAHEDKIISIDKVQCEIDKYEDDLQRWCSISLPGAFFKDSSTVLEQYGTITSWAYQKKDYYNRKAIDDFLDAERADAFLTAFCYAKADERILVTYERSRPESKNSIKIPDVCNHHGIGCIHPIEMLRQLRVAI